LAVFAGHGWLGLNGEHCDGAGYDSEGQGKSELGHDGTSDQQPGLGQAMAGWG
jgi:hypothetical protein